MAGLQKAAEGRRSIGHVQLSKEDFGVDEVAKRRQRESELQVWEEFEGELEPNFFSDIAIARDGGFSEVGDLWYPMRWLTAAITVFFLFSNLYYTVYIDVGVIFGEETKEDRLSLIGQSIAEFVLNGVRGWMSLPPTTIPGAKIVAGTELALTLGLLLSAVRHSVIAACGKVESKRWFSAEVVWWDLIPDLYTYSAMRLLHHVSPQVFVNAVSVVFRSPTAWKSLFFISRAACLIVGFDAFLLKCRESRSFIEAERISVSALWCGLIFLKQVLGIVQLGMFVRDRLFIFIFAGEDGIMQRREASLQRVWNAMLVRKIWRMFSPAKAVAIMLSFDDSDFQKLVLNDRVTGRGKFVSPTTSDEEDEDSSA